MPNSDNKKWVFRLLEGTGFEGLTQVQVIISKELSYPL